MSASADFDVTVNVKKNDGEWVSSSEDNWMLVGIDKDGNIRWSITNKEEVAYFARALLVGFSAVPVDIM